MIDAETTDSMPEVSGADLLNKICDIIKKYVAFVDEHLPIAITLWIAANHALPAWHHATRLAITSPQKRCGKSRLLDVIAALSFSPLLVGNATSAAVYRSIGDDSQAPTLFFDEVDALFGTKRASEQNEELRALLNAGWQRDRPVIRCVGSANVPTEFNTFAMVALAAIGRLPDTVTDRAINIGLRRRGRLEHVSSFRLRRDGELLNDLRDRLSAWVRDEHRLNVLAAAEPSMPVEDRAADAWEPLVAVADEAGGDWPTRARDACKALVDAAETADEDQLTSIQLLNDIRQVFDDRCLPFLESADLVAELWAIADSPWSDFALSQNRLAFQLRDYGIKSTRNATGSKRGYRLADFKDAFDRYLRHETSENNEPQSSISHRHESFDGQESPDALECQTDDDVSDRNRSSGPLTDVLSVSDGDLAGTGFGGRNGHTTDRMNLPDQTAAPTGDEQQFEQESDPSPVSNPRAQPPGQTSAELFDGLRRRFLGETYGKPTANPSEIVGAREPEWITGICDRCDDRSGPPLIDTQTGRCTKCWTNGKRCCAEFGVLSGGGDASIA